MAQDIAAASVDCAASDSGEFADIRSRPSRHCGFENGVDACPHHPRGIVGSPGMIERLIRQLHEGSSFPVR
jgi:hypothetical protein